MPYSKAVWLICKEFGTLPSDPRIRDLQPLQMSWILSNMAKDAEAYNKKDDSGDKQTFSMDDEDFEDAIRSLKQGK